VTIITPTIEGRELLLAEAAASVQAQTESVVHFIRCDTRRRGPAMARNDVLEMVQTPFVGFLDDDDLLDPEHVESLMRLFAQGSALPDLAWSRCRVETSGVATFALHQPIRPDYQQLARGGRNFIPVTVIARTASIRAVGGFDPLARYEDYDLWCRMLHAGQRFAHLPVTTWTYRMAAGNRTFA
jgi:glycosyltransferase involved in cell wall biosynthesis